jgi:hypothetical protein
MMDRLRGGRRAPIFWLPPRIDLDMQVCSVFVHPEPGNLQL